MYQFRACRCSRGLTASPHCLLVETWEDKKGKPWASSSFSSAGPAPQQWQRQVLHSLLSHPVQSPCTMLAWSPWQLSSKSPLGLRVRQRSQDSCRELWPSWNSFELKRTSDKVKTKILEVIFFFHKGKTRTSLRSGLPLQGIPSSCFPLYLYIPSAFPQFSSHRAFLCVGKDVSY